MSQDKVCPYCAKAFTPHPRLGQRQITCGSVDCKRRQKILAHKRWKDKNLKTYLDNQIDWRRRHLDYWKTYRKNHPDYVERNRIQTKLRKSRSKNGLQKRIVNLQPCGSLAYFLNLLGLQNFLDRFPSSSPLRLAGITRAPPPSKEVHHDLDSPRYP